MPITVLYLHLLTSTAIMELPHELHRATSPHMEAPLQQERHPPTFCALEEVAGRLFNQSNGHSARLLELLTDLLHRHRLGEGEDRRAALLAMIPLQSDKQEHVPAQATAFEREQTRGRFIRV